MDVPTLRMNDVQEPQNQDTEDDMELDISTEFDTGVENESRSHPPLHP